MARQIDWEELLKEYPGRDKKDKVLRLYEKLGSTNKVANLLGVMPSTIVSILGPAVKSKPHGGGRAEGYKEDLDQILERIRIREKIKKEGYRQFLRTKQGQAMLQRYSEYL